MISPIVRDVQRQRCCKRGSGDGQRLGLDYGTTERSFNAVERRGSTLTWTVCTAAYSEERQICTTCLFAESVGLCLCFLPSCAMYKDNAVRNVVAEMGRDLVFMITARLSDLSMPLKGEVRRSPVQSARQPIARSSKFVRRAYSRRALDCEKDDGLTCMYAFSCMLSPIVIVEHTSVWEGVGGEGRFDVASRSQTPKTSCQNHKQQLLRPRSGPSKVAHTRTTGLKNSK